ncbi:MAG: aconitate hydratase, partial [Armatimonadetes bacterium]|nr:aconitate hydratase [Armatimonadota bacterium]
ADDHRFLQTVAAKRGIYFSRPGNGICHQVHLERFGIPGKTLLGSDSHTPTAGGLGIVGIGAGGLDVALAMAGMPFYLRVPEVLRVTLLGELPDWVAAHDVILWLLQQLSVSGAVGKALEYRGPGVTTLNVPQRATITNMGAELGATTSVFPSDEVTHEFLRAQGREEDWAAVAADEDAEYEEEMTLELSALEPMIAQPHSPDNVVPVAELAGMPIDQVCIGSCTNSSYQEMVTVAQILRGQQIAEGLSLTISPGSRQVLEMLARSGALADMLGAGARILEAACGPCIGMGQSPSTDSVTLRSFNRNFPGRSGTKSAGIYLASPAVCAASALAGELVDPRELGEPPSVSLPEQFLVDDSMIIPPAEDTVEIRYGPNIKPVPEQQPLAETLKGEILLKVGDNISTDQIVPAGAKILPLRSNIPAISEHVFEPIDREFAARAQEQGGGMILGGRNYGQGSSRE